MDFTTWKLQPSQPVYLHFQGRNHIWTTLLEIIINITIIFNTFYHRRLVWSCVYQNTSNNAFILCIRMPAETRPIRNRSAVGRFPSVTFGFGDGTEEEKEQPTKDNAETGNACQQWLRKICPCCRPTSHDDTLEDTVVTGVDDPEKDDHKVGKKPVTVHSEMNGNWHV